MGLFDNYLDSQQFADRGGLLGRLLSLQQQQSLYPNRPDVQAMLPPQTPVLQPISWPNLPGYGGTVSRQAAAPDLTSQYQALRPLLGDHGAMLASVHLDLGRTLIAQAFANQQSGNSIFGNDGRMSAGRQFSDHEDAPRTGFTVRPSDSYSPYDSKADVGEDDSLDGLQTPQVEPQLNQATVEDDRAPPSISSNPNFRQLSRVTGDHPTPSAMAALDEHQPNTKYGQPVLSDVNPDPVRPGSQYAQAMGLCAGGLPGCAIGGALTIGQILLGGTALLGGATILNSRKSSSSGSQSGNDQTTPQPDSERYQQLKKDLAAQKAARAEAVRKKWEGKLNDPHDYCTQRHDDDVKECYKNAGGSRDLAACLAQAARRLAECSKNGGPSRADPPKWSPDEE
jgi:hypothetical protein